MDLKKLNLVELNSQEVKETGGEIIPMLVLNGKVVLAMVYQQLQECFSRI
jgi:hypothetical protein